VLQLPLIAKPRLVQRNLLLAQSSKPLFIGGTLACSLRVCTVVPMFLLCPLPLGPIIVTLLFSECSGAVLRLIEGFPAAVVRLLRVRLTTYVDRRHALSGLMFR
jgi:hypothetical protein